MTECEFKTLCKYLGNEKALEVSATYINELMTLEGVEDMIMDYIFKRDYDVALDFLKALKEMPGVETAKESTVIKRCYDEMGLFEKFIIVDNISQFRDLFSDVRGY